MSLETMFFNDGQISEQFMFVIAVGLITWAIATVSKSYQYSSDDSSFGESVVFGALFGALIGLIGVIVAILLETFIIVVTEVAAARVALVVFAVVITLGIIGAALGKKEGK